MRIVAGVFMTMVTVGALCALLGSAHYRVHLRPLPTLQSPRDDLPCSSSTHARTPCDQPIPLAIKDGGVANKRQCPLRGV